MTASQRSKVFIGSVLFCLAVVGFATVGEARMTCVQYVRALTDFEIRGDGWMWWHRAEGVYPRGKSPRIGSVMVFGRQSNLPYGHVAVVSDIIDERTVLVNHSWVRRLGLRCGAVVVDSSANNDWSRVRVWHGPTNRLGNSQYRILGFVYPRGSRAQSLISLEQGGANRPLSKKLPPHYVWCKPMVMPAQKPSLRGAPVVPRTVPIEASVEALPLVPAAKPEAAAGPTRLAVAQAVRKPTRAVPGDRPIVLAAYPLPKPDLSGAALHPVRKPAF